MKKFLVFGFMVLLSKTSLFSQIDSVQITVSVIDFDTKIDIDDFKIVVHSVDGKEIKYYGEFTSPEFKLPYSDEYWISIVKEDYFECKTYITLSENVMYEATLKFLLINRYSPPKE